jgi:TatD DNase family protein
VAIDRGSAQAVIDLARRHSMIDAAVGIHPNSAAEAAPGDWERIVELAADGTVVAIGETGIDRYRDHSPLDVQRDYFARHLELARRVDKPVIVHCRDAEDDVLDALRHASEAGAVRGVLHAFSGDEAFARACLELGLYISFAGMVSYTNRKFRPLRDVARTIPDDRLLIETDSPFLVPHPLRGRQRRNEPSLIRHTAASLAELRGVSVERLIAQTTENARRLFSHVRLGD